jgi:hypothetical protein
LLVVAVVVLWLGLEEQEALGLVPLFLLQAVNLIPLQLALEAAGPHLLL